MHNGQLSRADVGSIGPSALPASVPIVGSSSARQNVASYRSQRARAVTATSERRPMHACNSVLAALPQPRHGELAAADLAASHTGLDIPVRPIEVVRTHASAISTGALAVFRAFRTPSPAAPGGPRAVRCGYYRSFAHIQQY